MPAALYYFVPVLVDDVEGVAGERPYFLFHAEDGLFGSAVGRVYAQGWGEGCQLGAHFVCSADICWGMLEELMLELDGGRRKVRRVLESNWKPRCLMDFERNIYAHPSRRHIRLPRASAATAPSRVLHSVLLSILTYVRLGSALWRSLRNLASVCQSHWLSRSSGTLWNDRLAVDVR